MTLKFSSKPIVNLRELLHNKIPLFKAGFVIEFFRVPRPEFVFKILVFLARTAQHVQNERVKLNSTFFLSYDVASYAVIYTPDSFRCGLSIIQRKLRSEDAIS